MNQVRTILLAEDDEFDAEFTIEALTAAGILNPVVRVEQGAEALDYLYRRGAHEARPAGDPALVILDIKMPGTDGHEVLSCMRKDPAFKHVPVVMLTSSRLDSDVARSWDAGVNAYVVKPVNPQLFTEAVQALGTFWARVNVLPFER